MANPLPVGTSVVGASGGVPQLAPPVQPAVHAVQVEQVVGGVGVGHLRRAQRAGDALLLGARCTRQTSYEFRSVNRQPLRVPAWRPCLRWTGRPCGRSAPASAGSGAASRVADDVVA